MKPKKSSFTSTLFLTLSIGMTVVAGIQSAAAATAITFANPTAVTQTVISTNGSPTLTVADGTAFAVGDIIRFTAAGTSPFGVVANYYIVSVSGNDLTVAATPGGTALNATVDQAAAAIQLSQSISKDANWTGGTAPNSNSQIANFASPTGGVPAFITTVDQTLYGINQSGSGSDLTIASGANGTGYYKLTFATDDASIPKISEASTTRVISLGSTSANANPLVIAGTQGLIFNGRQGGAITGTGTAATSTVPAKNIRLWNIDWSGFSGGITVERGEASTSNVLGTFPSQPLTVGNAQTITNNTLAGLSLGAATTVVSLNGNSLGRVFGANTLTVGNLDGTGGDYAGVIGKDFTGASNATNLVKTGAGTQTISGVMSGTGALTVNAGTLTVSGNIATTGTVNASGGTLALNSANTYYSQTNINNGGTLKAGNASALGGRLAPSTVLDITTTDTSDAATVVANSPIVVGESVTGAGIPAGTVITAYTASSGAVTLSQAATATGIASATFVGIDITTTNGSPTATVAIGSPVAVNMSVTASGIPSGTRVSAYDSLTGTVTLTQNASADATVNGAFAGTTALNGGGVLDLNGQAITEYFVGIGGTFFNSNTGTPAQIVNDILQSDNAAFDGPGDISVNNIRRTNGVTRRITKNGAGTLTLGGDQDNSRYGLTVNAGNVILAKTNGDAVARFALIMNNASSTVSLTNSSDQITDDERAEINAGTLDLNGYNESLRGVHYTGDAALTGGIITNSNGSDPSTLSLGTSSVAVTDDSTWAGAISGNLSLVKTGANTQTLTGSLSYTGNTTVSVGTLSLSSATLANTGAVSIATGAVLNLDYVGTDVVGSLSVGGGAPLAANTYDASSPETMGYITGTGKLQVGAASGYASWSGTYAGGQSPSQDYDNDGMSNGVEYFMNITTPGFTANPALNSAKTITWTNGGNIPVSGYGTQYVVQTSGDLVNWLPVVEGDLTTNTAGPGGSLTYTLTGSGKRFVRLKVTPN